MTFVSKRSSLAVGVFVGPDGLYDHDAIRFLSLHADEIIVLDAHGFDLKHRWSDHANVSVIEHDWSDCFSGEIGFSNRYRAITYSWLRVMSTLAFQPSKLYVNI